MPAHKLPVSSPVSGSLVMVAFGIGTWPSMLGMSLAAPTLAAMLSDQWTKKLMGAALILLAVLSVSLLAVKMQSGQHQHASAKTMVQSFIHISG